MAREKRTVEARGKRDNIGERRVGWSEARIEAKGKIETVSKDCDNPKDVSKSDRKGN